MNTESDEISDNEEEGTQNVFDQFFHSDYTKLEIWTMEEENEFLMNGCGCKRQCHQNFAMSTVLESRAACAEMKYYCSSDHVNHHHQFIMGKTSIRM